MQGMRVQSQVWELRFHVSWGHKIKTYDRRDIVANSVETLKNSLCQKNL